MEENISANPANITLLGSIGIMLEANRVANLIEEFSRSRFHREKENASSINVLNATP